MPKLLTVGYIAYTYGLILLTYKLGVVNNSAVSYTMIVNAVRGRVCLRHVSR